MKNVRELFKALEAGHTLKHPNKGSICYGLDGIIIEPYTCKPRLICDLKLEDSLSWSIIHWYDEIPDSGILCRVSNKQHPELQEQVAVIERYDSSFKLFFDFTGTNWKFALPVSATEIKMYTYKGGVL